MFFESGSPTPSSVGKELIVRLAQQLGKLPSLANAVMIEGHTDFTSLFRTAGLFQLGAFHGSGQCRSADHGRERIAARTSHAGPGIRGSKPTRQGRSGSGVEPARVGYRPLSERRCGAPA